MVHCSHVFMRSWSMHKSTPRGHTTPPVTLQASHGAMHGSCKHRIDRRSEGDIKKELGTVGALEMQEQLGVIRAVERRGGS